ncbi:unnamed protein product [Allacma fusca]|uniref:Uncharacterized protein n=1 Tax=Allacma fusca TaxID=39272 RepID=A0A8J2JXY4_9HEXA|nr:unnamed protein product [Allacma fusca]
MRYHIVALVLQIIALVLGLVALGLESYVYHCDRMWFSVVILGKVDYFDSFLEPTFKAWEKESARLIAKYGPFDHHHNVRTRPLSENSAKFLRHPKTELNIFLAFLILTVLMQLVALIITIVRKVRFLPRPCRENGWWHFIIGIIGVMAVVTEIIGRLQVNAHYDSYTRYTNSGAVKQKIGALMLSSCGPSSVKYEALLSSAQKSERNDLDVCQAWWFFLACVITESVNIVLCFVVALLLCLFWRKKKNVEDADAEETPQNPNQPEDSDTQDNKYNNNSVQEEPDENKNNNNTNQPQQRDQQQPTQQQPNQQPDQQQPTQEQPNQQPDQQQPTQEQPNQQPNQPP